METQEMFKNDTPPLYFCEWVIRNLRQTFSKESLIVACEESIATYPGQKVLFQNLIFEITMNAHQDVLVYYETKSVQK